MRTSKTSSSRRDTELARLVAKRDERLLADAGLTLAGAMGEERFFWAGWARMREPWTL